MISDIDNFIYCGDYNFNKEVKVPKASLIQRVFGKNLALKTRGKSTIMQRQKAPLETARMSNYDCPLCGQYMDFIVTSHKSKPFVDGKCYPKMCFGCFHVPQQYLITYNAEGSVDTQEGPLYSHRILETPEGLFQAGATSSLREAEKCVEGVKRACRSVGVKVLDKLKLRRPDPDYDFNPEYEAKQTEIWAYKRRKKMRADG